MWGERELNGKGMSLNPFIGDFIVLLVAATVTDLDVGGSVFKTHPAKSISY